MDIYFLLLNQSTDANKIVICPTKAHIWKKVSAKISLLPKIQLKRFSKKKLILTLSWASINSKTNENNFFTKRFIFLSIFSVYDARPRKNKNIHLLKRFRVF